MNSDWPLGGRQCGKNATGSSKTRMQLEGWADSTAYIHFLDIPYFSPRVSGIPSQNELNHINFAYSRWQSDPHIVPEVATVVEKWSGGV